MSFDLLIRGATVVVARGQQRSDVGVVDGLIAALGPELPGRAAEEIDAAGLHLLPGVVDAHVHMNEPGRADWEGFDTGTRALAAGGATAAIDMPRGAHPPTVTGAAFDEKRRCLRHALAEGTLPMVASDHSPAPWELKSDADAFAAWGGISGCQTMLPLLLSDGHRSRGLELALITRVTSQSVARRFRLPRKGVLEPGADADLVLVGLTGSYELAAEDLQYRHRHSPFLGRTLSARVARTIVRGRTVFADGRIVGPPAGRLLKPTTIETESR